MGREDAGTPPHGTARYLMGMAHPEENEAPECLTTGSAFVVSHVARRAECPRLLFTLERARPEGETPSGLPPPGLRSLRFRPFPAALRRD